MKLELPGLKGAETSADGRMLLMLEIVQDSAAWLSEKIASVLNLGEEELVRFEPWQGQSWIVYVKKREGDSRALYAHPDTDQWVGTLALEESVLRNLHLALSTRSDFRLGAVCRLAPPSNLDLAIRFG